MTTTSAKRPERQDIMLAHPATPRRIAQLGSRFLVQPKLNGERCWVEWYNSTTPVLLSSYGNEFSLPHITNALVQQGYEGYRLDGELYITGEPFETIHSIASASRKSPHPRVEEMQFHIFDLKSDVTQVNRLAVLGSQDFLPPLHFVDTKVLLIDSPDHRPWEPLLELYIEMGYEGIIFRQWDSPYTERRTPALLKFKPTHSDTYRIIDTQEGEGWATNMLGSFIVTGNDNTPFRVGSGRLLTKDRRRKLWELKDQLPGKLLEVKHEALTTTKGIPKCAVALSIIGLEI